MSRSEYHRLKARERRIDDLAEKLYQAVQARRAKHLRRLLELGLMEQTAHDSGPNGPRTWDMLATVYVERQEIEAELLILENAHARDVARFLNLTPGEAGDHERAIENVLMYDGLTDGEGRFIPLTA